MNLALRDKKIDQIHIQIALKKQQLFHKLTAIQQTAEENTLLSSVVDDYKKYFDILIEEKQKQYEALQLLSCYLDNITFTTDLTDSILNESKLDQRHILREMQKVKKNLDELISTPFPLSQ